MNMPRDLFTQSNPQQREREQAEQRQQTEQQQQAKLAKLTDIVKNSSEQNRNFFIAYLGLLLYVQAIIFSTTDLQLLVSSDGLKLPIVDLTVPLVGFYVVIPIFVIALHFNFLQNLESHHYKLMCWQQAHADHKVPRDSIYPFLFDYATLEKDGQFRYFVQVANSMLCYNLAPTTLGLLLIRFSDRQDFLVTFWHYFAFMFDVFLVWKLGLALKHNEQAVLLPETPIITLSNWRFFIDRRKFRYGLGGLFGVVVSCEMLLTGLIGATSDENFVAHVQSVSRIEEWRPPKSWYDFVGYEFIESTRQIISRPIEWLLPRIAINPTETVWQPDVKELEASAKLAGYSDWSKYFNEQGEGFRPEPKSLRLVRLPAQNLPRAQFQTVKLQGAYLTEAQLQGADLREAQLQGADLNRAVLQGANLTEARLQKAYLNYAQLQRADLTKAKLQEVVLVFAELQMANLSETKLQHTHLNYAQLQGANLWNAGLQGANLSDAGLQGADLSSANLQEAVLMETRLQGANLSNTSLQGTDLRLTQLQGAILHQTVFQQTRGISETAIFALNGERFIDNSTHSDAKQKLHHEPANVAIALLDVCSTDDLRLSMSITRTKEPRLAGAQGFRKNYRKLEKLDMVFSKEKNPEYQTLLQDIDRNLCTLKECADLRNDIEGLNCKPYEKPVTR